ncbi:TIGR02391 family protein [Methylobacterium thuringiense]|uniref:Conserved hypothetical protein CHP02391 domain-containing protein n=1 Tax=Methylobacterium thuringiense TaxID=1003091 RepID=A0ABQ4TTV8_9HYPH|nr:TIGR02391 family protein [Methylobacterium thuringiense]GJE57330.1 hypothetical protein EKPJFOCH_3844 [Methylobacterium thuringiense]
MHISDLLHDADTALALEPDELGVYILISIKDWHQQRQQIDIGTFEAAHINNPGNFAPHRTGELKEACREAWAWLEGQGLLLPDRQFVGNTMQRVLSRRARRIAQARDHRDLSRSRFLPQAILHPVIREDVWGLFHRGKYDTAVFEAMKAVEVAVREAAGLTNADYGTDLMRKAFNPQGGPLTDGGAEKGEREARSALFAGAIGSYKNPQSHRHVALDDPSEAAEIIMLANHLLRIVDGRISHDLIYGKA